MYVSFHYDDGGNSSGSAPAAGDNKDSSCDVCSNNNPWRNYIHARKEPLLARKLRQFPIYMSVALLPPAAGFW